MSNLGLNCLHTAKIAMYFKGVQVHNVLVLEYVTLETCMHSNLAGLQYRPLYRTNLRPYFRSVTSPFRYISCNGKLSTLNILNLAFSVYLFFYRNRHGLSEVMNFNE